MRTHPTKTPCDVVTPQEDRDGDLRPHPVCPGPALEAEKTERQRLADADTAELQQAASVRLATRQSVREALDDVLDESSDDQLDKAH